MGGASPHGGRSSESPGELKRSLVWITLNAESVVLECARVSTDPSKVPSTSTKLLSYLIRNKHWSPFEMVSLCLEIKTSRAIARQMLRHRTFSFQEFSQRYQEVGQIQVKPLFQEARIQDHKNRQNSFSTNDAALHERWLQMQQEVWDMAITRYNEALRLGIAKEQARALLPEGLTQSRLYMTGTLRSWIHYCQLRCENGTQKEHADIAKEIRSMLFSLVPTIAAASFPNVEY